MKNQTQNPPLEQNRWIGDRGLWIGEAFWIGDVNQWSVIIGLVIGDLGFDSDVGFDGWLVMWKKKKEEEEKERGNSRER